MKKKLEAELAIGKEFNLIVTSPVYKMSSVSYQLTAISQGSWMFNCLNTTYNIDRTCLSAYIIQYMNTILYRIQILHELLTCMENSMCVYLEIFHTC